jgi:SAM-dependent methyltransferase
MLWRGARKIEPFLLHAYRSLTAPPKPNLAGDRDIEYSWIVANMPDGPGKALDFGCGTSWLGLAAARKGFTVTALDSQRIIWPYTHELLRFAQSDISTADLPAGYYDLLICCSTVEHVGLTGRYGAAEELPDADLAAMRALAEAAKVGGVLLLTVPLGKDRLVRPWHRVYGARRLPRLLAGWNVLRKEYWIKDKGNVWTLAGEAAALSVDASDHYYALGLFVLSPAAALTPQLGL